MRPIDLTPQINGMPSSGPRVPALTILSHPNVGRVGERAILWEDAEGGEAFLARRQVTFKQPRGGEPRGLEDPYLSRRPARISAARFGGIRIDCTRTSTRVIANDDWITEDRVFLGVEVQRGVVLILSERVSLVLHNLEPDDLAHDDRAHHGRAHDFGLVGESSAMARLWREMEQCGATTSPILLRGEAGTGKKAVARALHKAGEGERPFVAMRPGHKTSLPAVPDLLDRAAGGTLVLDAVHRMDEELRSGLTRELSHGDRSIRVIATCSDGRSPSSLGPLEALDWTSIEVPSLAQRRDDVGRLVFHFMHQELDKLGASKRLADPGPYAFPWFPVRLIAALANHPWPGNIGQLRSVIERLVGEYHQQDHFDVDLDRFIEGGSENSSTGWGLFEDSEASSSDRKLRTPTEAEVLAALREHRWKAEPAAAQLGLEPEVLLAMMEEKFSQEPGGAKKPRRPRSIF